MLTQWKQHADLGVTFPLGFVAAGVRCGLKTQGDDLALIFSETPASAAAVFTTNVVQAASVRHSKRVAAHGSARAVVCNAGNANACNGPRGDADALRMAELAAASLRISTDEVFVASTGVIGHAMPMEKLEEGIPRAADLLDREGGVDMTVARAMMTTDLRPKTIAVQMQSDAWEGELRIGGSCKGSGMIAPNMATMLCFITTDAALPAGLLQEALSAAVARTFNRVTVDSDTSTNDTVAALAGGASGVEIAAEGPAFDDFCQGLERVCRYLARELARDGEGATKLVEVVVKGARTERDAETIARSIADSPLVKTALYGNDPNWGRILAAAGKCGVAFDPERLRVAIGGIPVYVDGAGASFDAAAARETLAESEVRLVVDLRSGGEQATFWTCDFSYDYVKINAEYHT